MDDKLIWCIDSRYWNKSKYLQRYTASKIFQKEAMQEAKK